MCVCVCVCGRGAAHVRVCTQCACAMCVHVHVYVGKSGCTHVCMCVEALEGVYQRRREIFQKGGFPIPLHRMHFYDIHAPALCRVRG